MTLDYLAAIRSESARFHELIAGTRMDAPVPSCPGWSIADLAWHLAEVQYFWGGIAAGLLLDPAKLADLERPANAEVPDLFALQSARLVDALARRDPDDACWSWHAAGHSIGWVRRRQAHEALIHRVDAELAAGDPSPIDAGLAADGVDEIVGVFLDAGDIPEWSRFDPEGRTVVVALTDAPSAWALALGRFTGTSPTTGTTYDEEAVKQINQPDHPDTVLRGAGADLDLWLWGRGRRDAILIEGDPEAAAFLRAAAAHATQ